MLGMLKKKLVDGELKQINNKLSNAFWMVEKDVNSIVNWLNHVERKHGELANSHKSHIKVTEEDVTKLKLWVKDIHEYNRNLRDYLQHSNNVIKTIYEDQEELKKEIKELKQLLMVKKAEKVPEIVKNEINKDQRVERMLTFSAEISDSDRAVVNILFNADKPLTYFSLSELSNLNYGTVKNIIYRLRKKGIDVKDRKNPEGEKEFFLTDKAKIEISGR